MSNARTNMYSSFGFPFLSLFFDKAHVYAVIASFTSFIIMWVHCELAFSKGALSFAECDGTLSSFKTCQTKLVFPATPVYFLTFAKSSTWSTMVIIAIYVSMYLPWFGGTELFLLKIVMIKLRVNNIHLVHNTLFSCTPNLNTVIMLWCNIFLMSEILNLLMETGGQQEVLQFEFCLYLDLSKK